MSALVLAMLLGLSAQAHEGDAERGMPLYAKHCSQCHGDEGAADGPAAPFVYPRPRAFADFAVYKLRTTPTGELPTDDDLFAVIGDGIAGTSMPSFAMLTEEQRWDLVAVLKAFSEDFVDPDYTDAAIPMAELIDLVPTEASAEALARGRALYEANECFKCHGQQGRGDGPSWTTTVDDWGERILPTNLSEPETYRGGVDPRSMFRVMTTGLNGTPMPSYADSLTPDERWDLTHYVRSLMPAEDQREHDRVVAHEVARVPAGGDDPAWDDAPVARFPTMPNLITPPRNYWPAVGFVHVQALVDADDIALRVQWDDRSHSTGSDTETRYEDRDGAVYTDTEHPDQLALQFPTRHEDNARPGLVFGDGRRAVDLWWWRADTDALTARTARGARRLRDAADEQTTALTHQLQFSDGRYTLVVRRARISASEGSVVSFEAGRWIPLAVHVWDGSRGELGPRHAFTSWKWLFIETEASTASKVWPIVAFFLTLAAMLLLGAWVRRRES